MHLTLVRHGETLENAGGIVQGHRQSTLSPRGRRQIAAVARRLSDDSFDEAWSSDLERCVRTAEAILVARPGLPLRRTPLLREHAYGVLEGRRSAEVDWGVLHGPGLDGRPEGGESIAHVAERLARFVNERLAERPAGRLLVVTHGGPVRLLRAMAEGRPLGPLFGVPPLPNAGVLELEVARPLDPAALRW